MKNIKELGADISAGFVVYLVALPLCLGIALASGAPLLSGLISGIVAGLVVSVLSGSEVSVSGPAAGLTVIVANGITQAGSFEVFLFAVLVAGVMQLCLGILRVGALASLFPSPVISGMLSAIGIIIILKQIHHALGNHSDPEGDMNFFQPTDHETTFSEIGKTLGSIHLGALTIAAVALGIMFLWGRLAKKNRFFNYLPGPLVAVAAGCGLNFWFSHAFPTLYVGGRADLLVQLPVFTTPWALFTHLQFPTMAMENLPTVLSLALTIAIVASIESLLSLEAADKIDPFRRHSDPNKELIAQGVGNMICGLIGGLPMTAVIVRTSANIYAGARTRLSNFLHGAFLLVSVLGIAQYLNVIPLAALSAVLLSVGFKLSSPQAFKAMYQRGIEQFAPFIVTIVATVFTDLLLGVFVGIVTSMFFVVRTHSHSAITFVKDDNQYFIRFSKDMSFANKRRLKEILASIPHGAEVLVDGLGALFIDRDIIEELDLFRENAAFKNIQIEIKNVEDKRAKSLSPTTA